MPAFLLPVHSSLRSIRIYRAFVLFTGWGFVDCGRAYHMEQRSGRGQEGRADFQRLYMSQLVTVMRRGRIDQRATTLSARSRAVNWRRVIVGKYLSRLKIMRCQRRVVHSRGSSPGKIRKSVSAKARPSKPNTACENSVRQLPAPDSSPTRTTSLLSRDNCDKEAGGAVNSRMKTLRALVPGCSGLDTPIFLKEAADYIVALKMKVQALQALADCYSNSNADGACHVSE